MSHQSDDIPPLAPASGFGWDEPTLDAAEGAHPFGTPDTARYQRGTELGRGGMGRVVGAWDQRLHRQVAIKEIVTDDPAIARRLAQEAWITAQLDHPGIVSVYDAGQDANGRLFYVMRLVRGRSFTDALQEGDEPQRRLRQLLSVCQAVAYAHSRGIIHRDLKPGNVLVGDFGEIQVMDWGLARPVRRDQSWVQVLPPGLVAQTRIGVSVGTPQYMSPEQAGGAEVGPPSDVWSLGVILYELLARRPPFDGDTPQEIIAQVVTRAPRPLDDVPPELAAIVQRALTRDPKDRYADAGQMAVDLERYLDGQRVDAHTYTSGELLVRFIQAWRVPLLVASAVSAVAAVLLAGAVQRVNVERQRALAAEERVQAALNRSDENLRRALVAHAQAALKAGARAEGEVIAANALMLGDSPEARGVLAGFSNAPRPQLLSTTTLPDCSVGRILSNDGSMVLCVRDEETLLWSAETGAPIWTKNVSAFSATFGADAHKLLLHFGGITESGWLLDARTGALQPQNMADLRQRLHVRSASFVGRHNSSYVQTLNLDTGQNITHTPCNAKMGTAAVSHLNVLGTVCDDGRILINDLDAQDVASRAFQTTLTMSWTSVFSTDGGQMVIGTLDGQVALFDVDAGQIVEVRKIGDGMIRAIDISPDGSTVAALAERGSVWLWQVNQDTSLFRLPGSHTRIAFADNGDFITTNDKIRRWRLPVGGAAWLLPINAGVTGMQFSTDGTMLAVAAGSGASVWSLAEGRALSRWRAPDESMTTKDATMTPDGRQLLASNMGINGVVRVGTGDDAVLSSLETTSPLRRIGSLKGGLSWGLSWGFGPIVWDSITGEMLNQYLQPDKRFLEGETDPTASFSVLISTVGDVYRFRGGDEPALGLILRDPAAHVGTISGDGQRIALASNSQIWLVNGEGEELWRMDYSWPVTDMALSADGTLLAVGDLMGGARVWAAEDQTLIAVLRGHSERVSSVTFSPDGQTLASGSWDDTVRLWGLDSLDEDPKALARKVESSWGITLDEALSVEVW